MQCLCSYSHLCVLSQCSASQSLSFVVWISCERPSSLWIRKMDLPWAIQPYLNPLQANHVYKHHGWTHYFHKPIRALIHFLDRCYAVVKIYTCRLVYTVHLKLLAGFIFANAELSRQLREHFSTAKKFICAYAPHKYTSQTLKPRPCCEASVFKLSRNIITTNLSTYTVFHTAGYLGRATISRSSGEGQKLLQYYTSMRCLYCIMQYILYCTALHCTALHCTALHCTVLYCTVL